MISGAARAVGIDDVMRRVNAWRRPIAASSVGADFKEWMHFCVALPGDGYLVINLNVSGAVVRGSIRRTPRVIVLAGRGRWFGEVLSFGVDDVEGGRAGDLSVRVGGTRIEWRDGQFFISHQAAEVAASLRLRPLMPPTGPTSVSLGALHWVVVPRLEATGWVRLGSDRLDLAGSAAYHDHNWGNFRWGADLAWEWGFVHSTLADTHWSLVLLRISDRLRHRTLGQTVLLWCGPKLVRTFHNHEVEFELDASGAPAPALTLPKVAALLTAAGNSGVPRAVRVRACSAGDLLELEFQTADLARVALPSEVDPFGLVLLNETRGVARVRFRGAGSTQAFDAIGMMEFVRG